MSNNDNFYNYLMVAQTTIANMSMQRILDPKPHNYNMQMYIETLVEFFHEKYDFESEFKKLEIEQLIDIGFIYLNSNHQYMLIPIWCFPFIPEDYTIYLTNGEPFDPELEGYNVNIVSNQWVDLTIKLYD